VSLLFFKQKIKPIHIALIIIGAVLYGLGSFATMGIAIGTVTLRPAAFIACSWGILFGPWVGGFAAAIGNTFISDLLSGWFGIGGVGGFVGNFIMGFLPALLVRNPRKWLPVSFWSAISAVICGFCIAGWQVIVGIQPTIWLMWGVVMISNIPVNIIGTPIVVRLLIDRVDKRGLYWKNLPEKEPKPNG
jgi:energy-coupling factor transport system substrate-specific component